MGLIYLLHKVNPLIYRGLLSLLKNRRRGSQDFLVKVGRGGRGVIYTGTCLPTETGEAVLSNNDAWNFQQECYLLSIL